MAIIDKITKNDLLKIIFCSLVESYELHKGYYPNIEDKLCPGLTVDKALKALWNCTDPVPIRIFRKINKWGIEFKKRSYGAAARAFWKTVVWGAYGDNTAESTLKSSEPQHDVNGLFPASVKDAEK